MKPAENKVRNVLRPCQWQWQSFEGQGRADLWTLVLWIDIGKARAAITFPNLGSASGTPNKNDFLHPFPDYFQLGKCHRYPKIMKKTSTNCKATALSSNPSFKHQDRRGSAHIGGSCEICVDGAKVGCKPNSTSGPAHGGERCHKHVLNNPTSLLEELAQWYWGATTSSVQSDLPCGTWLCLQNTPPALLRTWPQRTCSD